MFVPSKVLLLYLLVLAPPSLPLVTLVPYSELPESEKEYDRRTALGALKLILALGYRIEKPR